MSVDRQYLRIKKITGRDIVRIAARHNLRELQAELGGGASYRPHSLWTESVIAGSDSAAGVATECERLMHDAAVGKLRRDAVRGVEIIVSLPTASSIDHAAFFSDSLFWVRSYFGVPVLSAVIHLDEAAPHCHVLLLPLVNGRMAGSDLVGNRARLQAMQTNFFEQVGSGYGLVKPKPQRRLNQATRDRAASVILASIQGNPELLDIPDVVSAMRELLTRDPVPMLKALRLPIPLPEGPLKTFVGIMTKPCKPEKPIGLKGNANPIGFDPVGTENHQTLSCVGFTSDPPAALESESCPEVVFTRCRDDEPSEYWDSEWGEFRSPKAVSSLQTLLGRSKP